MTTFWRIDCFADKSNQHLGSLICEYVYLLELPQPWQCGIRFFPDQLVTPEMLRILVDGGECEKKEGSGA